jgi:hypothetical protein
VSATGMRRGRRALLVACAVALSGVTAGGALAGLKPQHAPVRHGTLKPDPAPGAGSSSTAAKVALSTASVSVQTQVAPTSASPRYVVPSPRTTATPRRPAKPAVAREARRPRTVGRLRIWPDVRHGVASLTSLRAVPGSGRSWLLLAAGLALVLLAIGEATLLKLSAGWLELSAPPRSGERRVPESTYPVRQVLPRH